MNIRTFLEQRGVPFDILTHEPTYDAQHMAQAVHVSGHEVAKTVMLRADHAFSYIIAVLPATRMIDFQRLRDELGGMDLTLATKVEMTSICPDCEIGALPPFGSHYGLKTILDEALTNEPWIVFEGNTHNESIRMKLEDFLRLESPLVLPISTPAMAHT